jgi:hypothetical protein
MRRVDAVFDQLDFEDAVIVSVGLHPSEIWLNLEDVAFTRNHPANNSGEHRWVRECDLQFEDVVYSQRRMWEYCDASRSSFKSEWIVVSDPFIARAEVGGTIELEAVLLSPPAYVQWRIACSRVLLLLPDGAELRSSPWLARPALPSPETG